MNNTTQDLSEFGYIELMEASKLLKAYADSHNIGELKGLTLNFNSSSGFVFLSDEDLRVYMLNNDKIEEWFNCSYCGFEGFKDDFKDHKPKNAECNEFVKDCFEFENAINEQNDNYNISISEVLK